MDFSKRKLPRQAGADMRRCPISSLLPYVPMIAPIYVFMPRNEKFVALKAPLDFFLPDELERYGKTLSDFFVPEFIEKVLPARRIGRSTYAILSWKPRPETVEGARFKAPDLQPAVYEVSDAILRVVSPLWGAKKQLEPFFATIFATELCGAFPAEKISAARESGLANYECALLKSGMATLMAVHLGVCDLIYLKRLRDECFAFHALGEKSASPLIRELSAAMSFLINDKPNTPISLELFTRFRETLYFRLKGRALRIGKLIPADSPSPSVGGEGGFSDG